MSSSLFCLGPIRDLAAVINALRALWFLYFSGFVNPHSLAKLDTNVEQGFFPIGLFASVTY